MMKRVPLICLLLAAGLPATAQDKYVQEGHSQTHPYLLHAPQPAPVSYASLPKSPVASLSESEHRGLSSGGGLGLARSAELNAYPGPMHVVELKSVLGLSDAETEEFAALTTRVKAEAAQIGRDIIALEEAFNRLFAAGTITPSLVDTHTQAIAAAQGRLRAVHLKAHLTTRDMLSPHQVKLYDQARGYAPAAGGHGAGHRH